MAGQASENGYTTFHTPGGFRLLRHDALFPEEVIERQRAAMWEPDPRSYTYGRGYVVHHNREGGVMIPDQVFERQHLWDAADMTFPAITADDRVIEIKLCDTDA